MQKACERLTGEDVLQDGVFLCQELPLLTASRPMTRVTVQRGPSRGRHSLLGEAKDDSSKELQGRAHTYPQEQEGYVWDLILRVWTRMGRT